MINDVFAPVVKTLFIPDGNPGVQEVKEIRAVPRLIRAEGDAQEITVSGEMDLNITYVPIKDRDDEVPWRTIQFSEKDALGRFDNEEQVIARLESALKEDEEEDGTGGNEEWFRVDISVPFTLAIGTEGFGKDHIIRLDPFVHSTNWFLVSPKAIEFEAVLKLASQEDFDAEKGGEEPKPLPRQEIVKGHEINFERTGEPGQNEELISKAEPGEPEMREAKPECPDIRKEEPEIRELRVEKPEMKKAEEEQPKQLKPKDTEVKQELKEQKATGPEVKQDSWEQKPKAPEIKQEEKQQKPQESTPQTAPPAKPFGPPPIWQAIKQTIKQEAKPEAKTEIKPGEDRHSLFLSDKGYYQMKFYRVQIGEDLDAIADKFGISRERISTFNSINEEEIRTGLLLSIPRN